jgi:hypothetical protein
MSRHGPLFNLSTWKQQSGEARIMLSTLSNATTLQRSDTQVQRVCPNIGCSCKRPFSYRATDQIQFVHLTGYQAAFKQYLLPFEQKSAIFNTCAAPDSDSTESFFTQLINDRTEPL